MSQEKIDQLQHDKEELLNQLKDQIGFNQAIVEREKNMLDTFYGLRKEAAKVTTELKELTKEFKNASLEFQSNKKVLDNIQELNKQSKELNKKMALSEELIQGVHSKFNSFENELINFCACKKAEVEVVVSKVKRDVKDIRDGLVNEIEAEKKEGASLGECSEA